MPSVITTEHFPAQSSYPTLSSKRRRHRHSTSTVPHDIGSSGDEVEEERARKGMTVEYYDIHGRLLRLWSDQGDLFLPERGHSRCEDPSGSRTTTPALSQLPVTSTTNLARVGYRNNGKQEPRVDGSDAVGVGEFGRLRSRSVTRDGVRSGGREGRGYRNDPQPDWLEVPPRMAVPTAPESTNQSQSLPISSSRRTPRPVSTPPPEKRSQALTSLVQPSAKSLSQGSPLSRDAVKSKRASSPASPQQPSRIHRVLLNPSAPPLSPPSTSESLPPIQKSPPKSSSRSRYTEPQPESSSSATTASQPQQTRSLKRKSGFVLDRPKTQVLGLGPVPNSNLLHPESAVGLGHRRHLSSPPALTPTAPCDPLPTTTNSLKSEPTSVLLPPVSTLPPHRRNLSEGNIPNIFTPSGMEDREEELVNIDGEGARWYNCKQFSSSKGKERQKDDCVGTTHRSNDDEEEELRKLSTTLQPLPPSFWPSEWPILQPPPSSLGNHIDSQNLRSRRKSDFGVVGFASQTGDFDALSEGAEIDHDRDHLDGVPPLISAFGLGKGYPLCPPVRERKPTMGRWGRRVVVSDPGLLPVPALSVVDCDSTENGGA